LSLPRTGAANMMTGAALRIVIAAAGTIVIAAVIGPAFKGVLATLMSVSTIAAVALGWGLAGATSYYVATKRWSEAQYNALAVTWTLVVAGLSYVLFGLARRFGAERLLSGLTDLQLASATAVVLLYSLAGHAVLALKRFKFFAILDVLSAAANPFAFFVLLAIGIGSLGAAVWAWIVSEAVVAIAAQVAMLRLAKWRMANPDDLGGVARYAAQAGGWDVLNLMNLRLDVLLLRSMASASAVGAYALATQLTEVVWLVPVAIGSAVLPEVAEGGHDQGIWTARIARLTSSVSVALSLAVGVAGTVLIAVFLRSYVAGIPAIWLLLPGTAVAATSKVLGNDLNARGLPRALLWAAVASVIVTVVGDFTLIPLIGSVGAAIVSSAAYSIAALVLVVHFRSATGSRFGDVVPRRADLREASAIVVHTASGYLDRVRGVQRQ